jgi:hypothetical protein
VGAMKKFLDSNAKILVCTHATFRFAVDKFGIAVFDDRLIDVDEFHHVSANPDNKLGDHVRQLMTRDKTHIIAMTDSYFRGDAEAVMHPDDESKFATFKLANINRKGLEVLLQKFFGSARLELELQDRFGTTVNPREWFLVPLEVIETMIGE